MSEEIMGADALLTQNATLRARILEWEDTYDRLAGAFDLHMAIDECQNAMSDYAGVFYDVLLGEMAGERTELRRALEVAMQENEARVALDRRLRAELTLLRELADDVDRWRAAGGDVRDLRYVLETIDKIEQTKGTEP